MYLWRIGPSSSQIMAQVMYRGPSASTCGVVGIRHVLAAPYHPQTNGKLERYHRTLKDDINQVPYEVVEDLEAAIRDFVEFYNYRRYHQALRVVTPADVLEGRLEAILAQRKEVQRETF